VRDRLKLLAAGKLVNPARQIRAFASGADAVYTARGFMLALGCIQALQCNSGHCPVGITTHDKQLQRGLDLDEKAERVVNYARNLEYTLTALLAATGKHSFHQLTRGDLFLTSAPLEIA
jgi:glutamate synthase domain-containing protein 2